MERGPADGRGLLKPDGVGLRSGVVRVEVEPDRLGVGVDETLVDAHALIGQNDPLPGPEPAIDPVPVAGVDVVRLALCDTGAERQGLPARMNFQPAHQRRDIGASGPPGG